MHACHAVCGLVRVYHVLMHSSIHSSDVYSVCISMANTCMKHIMHVDNNKCMQCHVLILNFIFLFLLLCSTKYLSILAYHDGVIKLYKSGVRICKIHIYFGRHAHGTYNYNWGFILVHTGCMNTELHSMCLASQLEHMQQPLLAIYSTPCIVQRNRWYANSDVPFQSVTNDLLHSQFAMQTYVLHQVDVTGSLCVQIHVTRRAIIH